MVDDGGHQWLDSSREAGLGALVAAE